MHDGVEQQASMQQAREQAVLMDDGVAQRERQQTEWIHDGEKQQASRHQALEQAVSIDDGVGRRERQQVVLMDEGAERQARRQARHRVAPKSAGEEQ